MSSFFHRLLSEEDTDRRLVVFQNTDAGVFEEVLEYIYTGSFVIKDNFGDFLKLTSRLEMSVSGILLLLLPCRNRRLSDSMSQSLCSVCERKGEEGGKKGEEGRVGRLKL